MHSRHRCAAWALAFPLLFYTLWRMTPPIPTAASSERLHLVAKFTLGESLRYRIESQTKTTATITTPIANPEGGSQSGQVIDMLVRLDVLDVGRPGATSAGAIRFRATYEKSSLESEGDAFDPAAFALADQYGRVQGHSIEFTMDPGEELVNFRGLEDVFPDRSAPPAVLSWFSAISSRRGFPSSGITVGQKWRSERPVLQAPLSDLFWHAESTYLRNEPCDAAATASANPLTSSATLSTGECAVILTRFEISRHGSAGTSATPDDYLRNGLRTSGTWSGSGQSLDSISLTNGLLASSTQSSTQTMDYAIISASTGSSIHRAGKVESQTQIALAAD
jgi:hypothetical protein